MLRTITLGSCVSVQGLQVGQLPNGNIIVRVDEKNYVGKPIMPTRKSRDRIETNVTRTTP